MSDDTARQLREWQLAEEMRRQAERNRTAEEQRIRAEIAEQQRRNQQE